MSGALFPEKIADSVSAAQAVGEAEALLSRVEGLLRHAANRTVLYRPGETFHGPTAYARTQACKVFNAAASYAHQARMDIVGAKPATEGL